ncbi:cytochrome P450 [Chiua virens]|nr:cytochrome P450 [Chiua virens]
MEQCQVLGFCSYSRCLVMITSAIVYAIALGSIAVIYIGGRCLGSSRSSLPLPPGPPGVPWVGNVIGINTDAPWLTYREWAKTYGDIVYSRLLGKDIIIINSEKIAKELLENHSSNNSDRPYFITNELCGVEWNTGLLSYGDRWRLHRRFFHHTFRLGAVSRFLPFQHRKSCQLLRRLFAHPEQFREHLFEYTASVILQGTYDYDPPSQHDELFKLVTKVQEIALSVVRPDTAFIVETFPILLSLPSWLPGMSFKKEMTISSELAKRYVEKTFDYALKRVRSHSNAASMVHDALLDIKKDKGTESDEVWMRELKGASASDTSHSVLLNFFLMMMLNPSAQQKAQAQIEAVVGKARLPTMDDRPLLPYVDAIYRETLRCCPVLPLSAPHAATDEDVYNGFRIPKGALIFPNVWAMAHNETRYPNPDAFFPERWFNDDGTLKPNDTDRIVFGFGRRMCAGRHFAEISVWSVMVRVLAVFKILKPLDETGSEVVVEPAFTSGFAIHPVPFPCRIVPKILGMNVDMLDRWLDANTESMNPT